MRTVSALFDDYQDARKAVSELEAVGISSDDIGIVANNIGERYSDEASGAASGAGQVPVWEPLAAARSVS